MYKDIVNVTILSVSFNERRKVLVILFKASSNLALIFNFQLFLSTDYVEKVILKFDIASVFIKLSEHF